MASVSYHIANLLEKVSSRTSQPVSAIIILFLHRILQFFYTLAVHPQTKYTFKIKPMYELLQTALLNAWLSKTVVLTLKLIQFVKRYTQNWQVPQTWLFSFRRRRDTLARILNAVWFQIRC